jgi:hypothetical protein
VETCASLPKEMQHKKTTRNVRMKSDIFTKVQPTF